MKILNTLMLVFVLIPSIVYPMKKQLMEKGNLVVQKTDPREVEGLKNQNVGNEQEESASKANKFEIETNADSDADSEIFYESEEECCADYILKLAGIMKSLDSIEQSQQLKWLDICTEKLDSVIDRLSNLENFDANVKRVLLDSNWDLLSMIALVLSNAITPSSCDS